LLCEEICRIEHASRYLDAQKIACVGHGGTACQDKHSPLPKSLREREKGAADKKSQKQPLLVFFFLVREKKHRKRPFADTRAGKATHPFG